MGSLVHQIFIDLDEGAVQMAETVNGPEAAALSRSTTCRHLGVRDFSVFAMHNAY